MAAIPKGLAFSTRAADGEQSEVKNSLSFSFCFCCASEQSTLPKIALEGTSLQLAYCLFG